MGELKFICERDDFLQFEGWAEKISAATKEEKFLLYQPAEKLLEMAQKERIILAINEKRIIVGIIALWAIGKSWNEVGTIFVFPEYRRKGFGQEITRFAFERWNGQKIMSTSKNPLSMHIALKSGMVAVTSESDMKEVVPLTCVCDESDGVEDSAKCPFRDKDCVFLISAKTAQMIDYVARNDKIVQRARNYNFR